jgi:hypothetical protein
LMCLLKTMPIIGSYYIRLRRKPIMVPEKSALVKVFPGIFKRSKINTFSERF